MNIEMLYRIMETVSTFYTCHKDEISKEYARDLDEQKKELLSMIENQTDNQKQSWSKYTNSDYYKRYFKEKELQDEIKNLSNEKLLDIWDMTEYETDESVFDIRKWLMDEIAVRFPKEVEAWISCEERTDANLRWFVFHSKTGYKQLNVI